MPKALYPIQLQRDEVRYLQTCVNIRKRSERGIWNERMPV